MNHETPYGTLHGIVSSATGLDESALHQLRKFTQPVRCPKFMEHQTIEGIYS